MDSSFSSTYDELFDVVRRPRRFRERNNPIEWFDDSQFLQRYRFSKQMFTVLAHHLDAFLRAPTSRNFAIDPVMQLAIAMRFYATGSFQSIVGDQAHVSTASVCRIVKKVSVCISKHLLAEYINNPANELNSIKNDFFQVAGFPGIIGCIDCTHIKIQSPGGNSAELFRNRKGYFSLNVQAVCTSKLKVTDLVARWRGSVHDSTIFDNSRLRAQLENGEFGNGFLLGDSGYPCRNYLLTPILNPHTDAQQRYNNAHVTTRNTIERCFGVVKRRFPCLKETLRTKVETSMAIICATFILHNIAIELKEQLPNDEENEPEDEPVDVYQNGNMENTSARTEIINNIFG